ncbi:MAG TPA: FHA domain-containing protein [Dokdonella sp.]
MRLLFPGGEHAPVDLATGTTRVGTAPACGVVLAAPDVAAQHCEIVVGADAAVLRTLDAAATTLLNGRRVEGAATIRPGDLLLFGRVGCSVAADRRPPPRLATSRTPPLPERDGRTRVRATLPRFVLRGVSGATFGKTFPVGDGALIGRQPDCDITIPAEEISRHHARLRTTGDGVLVEDLGSANGTFVNDTRVQSGLLKPGDELRLDTVRFLLAAPGMDARGQSAALRGGRGGERPSRVRVLPVVLGVVALIALAVAAAWYSGAF